jgi:hypothetical protein
MAARMALDLDLPGSYTKLSALSFDSGGNEGDKLEEERLMRESRVWFGTFILENILSIDCGKKPGLKASSGAGMRRCRVLLGHPNRTPLDFRMLSQVEVSARICFRQVPLANEYVKLNSIRGNRKYR